MAKLTNAQLTAVIDTIKAAREVNLDRLKEESQEKIKKGKSYKQLMSVLEEQKKIGKLIEELKVKGDANSKELFNLIDDKNRSYYSYEYRTNYHDNIIARFLHAETNRLCNIDNIDYNSIKNEILVASIDGDFDIQRFINKYTN